MKDKKKKLMVSGSIIIFSMLFLSVSSSISIQADNPLKRFGSTMSYDSASDKMILYGGLYGGLVDHPSIIWYKDPWV